MNLDFKIQKFLLFPLIFFAISFRADYFPESDNWEISTPEDQGVSSDKINNLMKISFSDECYSISSCYKEWQDYF